MPQPESTAVPLARLLAAALVILALAGLVVTGIYQSAPKGGPRQVAGYTPWSPEVLAAAEGLPLQDGGRVKPLSAYAGFTLYALHGSRKLRIADSEGGTHSLTPTAWLLDTLFRPELAARQPVFRVDNSAVLEALGVKADHKRDRYSYADISPGVEKLEQLAGSYGAIPEAEREPLQRQILAFYQNVLDYFTLLHHFDFARDGIVLSTDGSQPPLRVGEALTVAPRVLAELKAAREAGREPEAPALHFYELVFEAAKAAADGPRLFPPVDPASKEWHSAGDLIVGVLNGDLVPPDSAIRDIRALETLCASPAPGEAEFLARFTALREQAVNRADARTVALEAGYHRMDWFYRALLLFVPAILTAVGMWLAGRRPLGRWLSRATLGLTVVALALCAIAIVQRCLIMGRSPVGNLYDTIIFIATTATALALAIEFFFRRRLALGVAPVIGAALVYLSRRFEMGDAKDHLDPLVAVLASNYWLTLHVITITLGYAAGLLAALLASIYILMRGLRLDQGDADLRRGLTLATYGTLCFTLFLSLVGTVLGGIWANDSWGRFWGWDPKENGALLIVIWTLVILHARLGGFLREWGFHLVIAFSWWHVNFLGVGLHNYGFTTGQSVVWTFYGSIAALLTFGAVAALLERRS
jgi:ABC-type transport system involved in cytochrome c biogenesis permease subunit